MVQNVVLDGVIFAAHQDALVITVVKEIVAGAVPAPGDIYIGVVGSLENGDVVNVVVIGEAIAASECLTVAPGK